MDFQEIQDKLNKINKDSIIVLDKNVYDMYKDSKLSDYRVIYNDRENLEYGYIIRDANENATFKSLFTTYMEMINYFLRNGFKNVIRMRFRKSS